MASKSTKEAAAAGGGAVVTILGYDLKANPQGAILAVLLDAVVGWVVDGAGHVAALIAESYSMLAAEVTNGLGYAIGGPTSTVAGLIEGFVETVTGLGVTTATMLGPFGFVGIPLAWAIGAVGTIALVTGIWRAYKWIRTVVA